MRVAAADGRELGTIDRADVSHIKLARNSTTDGHHHDIPIEWVERVDNQMVHLNRSSADVAVLGASSTGREVHEGRKSILPWLLGALAAIILLALLLRSCDRDDADVTANDSAPVATTTTTTAAATGVAAPVALPGGRSVDLAPGTINYDVQRYLAGTEATPRTFTFEKLNFESGRADIRAEDRQDLDNLAQILVAYPSVRVRVVGYTDAQGPAQPNAQLGLERARNVAAALTAKGVASDRLETASGGEANPADTNATAGGRFENRRTELIVLSR